MKRVAAAEVSESYILETAQQTVKFHFSCAGCSAAPSVHRVRSALQGCGPVNNQQYIPTAPQINGPAPKIENQYVAPEVDIMAGIHKRMCEKPCLKT